MGSRRAGAQAKERRRELWGMLTQQPYSRLVKGWTADIKPVPAKTFYTILCGRRRTTPSDTTPSGVIFQDDSYLTIFEEWAIDGNHPSQYEYHYQMSDEEWLRYDMDSDAVAPNHPEHHLQTSWLGGEVRLPTGKIKCEEVLKMIFEQFLIPAAQGDG